MSSEIDRNPVSAFRTAATFLTRLPFRGSHADLAATVWVFPLVGAFIGLLGSAVFFIAEALGLPTALSALLTIVGLYVLTGGLHEDGLADVADGFGGGASKERKLAIMRDSRIGTYGVAAMVFSFLARFIVLAHLSEPSAVCAALVASCALSRGAIGPVMSVLQSARSDGLSATAGRPTGGQAVFGSVVAVLIAMFAIGFGDGIATALVALAAATGVAMLAQKQIGGQTGDVLGAVAQSVEIAVLVAISAG